MNKIAICIPTYKRPELLKKLIVSITECNLNKSFISDVNIVIVDNDIDLTARTVVDGLILKFPGKFKIQYFSYPVKGLSGVRNELLRIALELVPDYIAFLDDDEYPSVEWLNELVQTIIANNGDMVMGPVISVFDNRVSKYLSCWFERPDYQNNTILNSIATNNLLIRTESLLKYKIRFDHRFNKTGAEDSYFGYQMMEKGATAFWSSRAVVYETVPEVRTNIRWLIRRYYNGANTYTFILKIGKQYLGLLKKTAISIIYIISGFCSIPIILLPIKRKYWGLLKLSEGIGSIAGLFSIKYYEYK
jgi:succinoglycan biosynthesis protein ExoM